MKVFIDFDDVIFNTYKFKNNFFAVFRKGGFTRKEVEKAAKNISSASNNDGKNAYSPSLHIKELKRIRLFDEKKMKREIEEFIFDLRKYVFDDCHEFLKSIPRRNLYLLSYGEMRFQKKKIRGSGMGEYFGHIIVTKENKIDKICRIAKEHKFKQKENLLFLDDRPDNLEKVEGVNKKIITFRVCRPQGRYSDMICQKKDYEVKDFNEIMKIIKRKKIR